MIEEHLMKATSSLLKRAEKAEAERDALIQSAISRKKRLLIELTKCAENDNFEVAHLDADDLLVEFIDDAEITKTYNAITK